jgi:hypothetical protein
MNKLKYVLLILIITSIQCKKATTEISIIGKWEMVSSNWKQYKNNVLIKEFTDLCTPTFGLTLNFKTDGKFTATDTDGTVQTFDYKYTVGKLEIGSTGEFYKIIELTSSKLIWSYENDVSGSNKEIVTDTFKKVN